MCLYATSQILIAEEDIPCYKILDVEYHPILPKAWVSPFQNSFYGFTFMKKWTKKAKFEQNPIEYHQPIFKGIHAYTMRPNPFPYYIMNAYIPKGTRYIIGRNNDIVAEKLVVILKG